MTRPKILILARHAKSSWEDIGLSDHDRPLNPRGRRDAPRMADRLAERGPSPERIVSSSAVRARATAEVFLDRLGLSSEDLVIEPAIYGADCADLIEIIRSLDDRYDCIMLVGHNPTFVEVAGRLDPGCVGHLPTCSVVTLELDGGGWSDGREGAFRLLDFDYPKKDRDSA